jgi:hypothetical protein
VILASQRDPFGGRSAFNKVPFLISGHPSDYGIPPSRIVEIERDALDKIILRTESLTVTGNASATIQGFGSFNLVAGTAIGRREKKRIFEATNYALPFEMSNPAGMRYQFTPQEGDSADSEPALVFLGGLAAETPADQGTPGSLYRDSDGKYYLGSFDFVLAMGVVFTTFGQGSALGGGLDFLGTRIPLYCTAAQGSAEITVSLGPDLPF